MYPNLVACDVRNSDIREPWDLEQHAANVRWNLADYGLAPKTNMLDYITFCIRGSSKICEQSIKTLYPTAKIVYANKFNTITTDYVLWCKDNQEITEASNVPALFAFLEKEFSYGVIGGTIIMGNESLYVYNTITEKEGALLQKRSISKFRQTDGLVWRQCDRVGPFCLARRECLKDTGVESFWSLKKAGEWNVAYTNQASVKISN
jgi:hypothetical protein